MSSACDFQIGCRSKDRDADEESESLSFAAGVPSVNSQPEGGRGSAGASDNLDGDDSSVAGLSLASFPALEDVDADRSFAANMDMFRPGAVDVDDGECNIGGIYAGGSKSNGGTIDDLDFDGGGNGGGKSGVGTLGEMERSDGSTSVGEGNGDGSKRKPRKDTANGKGKKTKTRRKDKKSSETAKKRELDKFKRWLSSQPAPQWSSADTAEKIEGDGGEEFLQFGKRMIGEAKELGMKDHFANRLNHVLDNSSGKTYAEMYYYTLRCFVPVKDGTRKEKYEKKHCDVCKAAGELVDQVNHTCPYCLDCFVKSGWKKECTLLEDCTDHGEGVDVEESSHSEL